MSVRSLRDAELEIEALKRQHNELVRELRALKLGSNGTTSQPTAETNKSVSNIAEADSIYNADKNTVLHRLLHIFKNIQVEDLVVGDIEADSVDIRSTPGKQLHISFNDSDQGLYIQNLGGTSHITSGAVWNGSSWIAKSTIAVRIGLIEGTAIRFFINTGLTVGSAITWTKVLDIPIALAKDYPLRTDAGGVLVGAPINLATEVIGVLPPANGGAGTGINLTQNLAHTLGLATDVINYKDHSGANATKTVLINAVLYGRVSTFTNGVLTA